MHVKAPRRSPCGVRRGAAVVRGRESHLGLAGCSEPVGRGAADRAQEQGGGRGPSAARRAFGARRVRLRLRARLPGCGETVIPWLSARQREKRTTACDRPGGVDSCALRVITLDGGLPCARPRPPCSPRLVPARRDRPGPARSTPAAAPPADTISIVRDPRLPAWRGRSPSRRSTARRGTGEYLWTSPGRRTSRRCAPGSSYPERKGQGRRGAHHSRDLRLERLDPQRRRPVRRATGSSPWRPDLISGLGPGGGGTDSVASRDDVVKLVRGADASTKPWSRLDAVRAYASQAAGGQRQDRHRRLLLGRWPQLLVRRRRPRRPTRRWSSTASRPTAPATADVRAPVLGHYGGDDARRRCHDPARPGGAQEAQPLLRAAPLRRRRPRLPARADAARRRQLQGHPASLAPHHRVPAQVSEVARRPRAVLESCSGRNSQVELRPGRRRRGSPAGHSSPGILPGSL